MTMRFLRIERWVLLPLVILLFLSFISSIIYILTADARSDDALGQKAERIAEIIMTSGTDNLSSYDVPALKKSMESLFSNRDISSLKILDNSAIELVNLSRPEKGTRETVITRKILKGGQQMGTLSLILTNYSMWEGTDRLADLIIDSNLDNIWDYNMEALTNSIETFLKDKSIEKITLREPSGHVLFERDRFTIGSEKLRVFKYMRREGKALGTIEIIFTNYTYEMSRREHLAVMAAVSVVLGVLMTFAFAVMSGKIGSVRMSESEGETAPSHAPWSVSASTEDKLNKAIDYINANFNREISREGLASMLEINPDNLGRYFKLYTGEKLSDFVTKLRVDAAAHMLAETDATILNIAFEAGFENISTFNRAFWKVKSVTPSEYRKRHR
ncbi:MAG: AraC family transcriptional regulator [Spirochaetes bacterium]|nr:MAG: AraC family transcriptional regulator [Spirochaetota bacterium]